MELLALLAFWGAVIIIHELGHILMYHKFTGRWIRLRWSWWGAILVGTKKDYGRLTYRQYALMAIMGPFAGFIPFLVVDLGADALLFLLLYITMCIVDISAILTVHNTDKQFWDTRIGDMRLRSVDKRKRTLYEVKLI